MCGPSQAGDPPRPMAWRGFLTFPASVKDFAEVKRLVEVHLPRMHCNVFVLPMWNYQFEKHRECADGWDPWSKAQVRELVRAGKRAGVRIIPSFGCLGHQEDYRVEHSPPNNLLRLHPDFEEPPDGRIPETDPASPSFYGRSWCPLHPEIMPIISDMIGELLDAFGTGAIHVGLDEVFGIASAKCPRCTGKDPAELFAKAVNDLHDVVVRQHGATMLMWGDRLLDAKALGENGYTASWNGTFPAIDRIPKDIIVCDWHYGRQDDYTSLDVLLDHGFQVWPSVYDQWDAAKAFIGAAERRKNPRMLGLLATHWSACGLVPKLLDPDPALTGSPLNPGQERERAQLMTSVRALQEAWRPSDPRSEPPP